MKITPEIRKFGTGKLSQYTGQPVTSFSIEGDTVSYTTSDQTLGKLNGSEAHNFLVEVRRYERIVTDLKNPGIALMRLARPLYGVTPSQVLPIGDDLVICEKPKIALLGELDPLSFPVEKVKDHIRVYHEKDPIITAMSVAARSVGLDVDFDSLYSYTVGTEQLNSAQAQLQAVIKEVSNYKRVAFSANTDGIISLKLKDIPDIEDSVSSLSQRIKARTDL